MMPIKFATANHDNERNHRALYALRRLGQAQRADAVVGHEASPLFIRKPSPDDGWGIYELVKSCPPLDVNSAYAYLLLATQFRDSCAVATNEEGRSSVSFPAT